jgi:hypothetical protein
VSLGALQEEGKGKKMLKNEKYWNIPSTYEYNITIHCKLLNCGEHGDREIVRNGGVNLIKAW